MSQSLSAPSVNKQIFRALLSLASAILLVRVIGLLNQIVVTARFGAGATMDAYIVAYSLPYLLAQLLISAVEYSIFPAYAHIRLKAGKEGASILFSTLFNLLLLGTALLALGMFFFRRQVIFVSAPALDPLSAGLAIELIPLLLPSMVLMTMAGLLERILNAESQFGWPAYSGLLVPLSTAVLVLIAGSQYGILMLCVGMLVGQCLQLGVLIVIAKRAKLSYRLTLNLRTPGIGLVAAAAWPALLAGLIGQTSPVIDQIFASFLTPGSISALNYSLKLVSVITAVLFGSIGRAILPYFAKQIAANDIKAFKETLRLYLWVVGISTALLTVFIIVLANPLVRILFQRGAFTASDTSRTATVLVGFMVGLMPMAFGFIASRALSTLSKNHLLMYVTVFSIIANAFFDYMFARLWQSEGIALATSAVYICTMFILYFMLRRVVGKLSLFTPPGEIRTIIPQAISRSNPGLYYQSWLAWKEERLSLYGLRRHMMRIGIIISVFAAGIVGVFLDSLYTLRAALGSVLVLVLLRYRYALLLAWPLIIVLKDSIPILASVNLLTGLIVPTLLAMAVLPLKETFQRMPALLMLFIYLLWVFTSIGISSIGLGAFLTEWTIFITYVAVGVLTINVLTARWRVFLLIDAMLLASTFVALYGIYGYITRQNGAADPVVGFRITSIFVSSPSLAMFLSLTIPLALYRTLTLRGLTRLCCAIQVPILLAALGLTFTRSAFISVPLSIVVMILFLPSREMKIRLLSGILALGLLAVVLATVYNIPVFSRFFSADIATLNGRTILWQSLLDHFDPTQLLGNGLLASDNLIQNLRVGFGGSVITDASHSLFLSALYDNGIIGATLLALVFIVLFANLIAGIRKSSGEHRMLFATALAAFVSMFLQSLGSNDFWIEAFSVYFWIIMALPFALTWYPSKYSTEPLEEALDDDNATVPRMAAVRSRERERLSHV
jgi:murein biosynthesis integral membrane protein MurJ